MPVTRAPRHEHPLVFQPATARVSPRLDTVLCSAACALNAADEREACLSQTTSSTQSALRGADPRSQLLWKRPYLLLFVALLQSHAVGYFSDLDTQAGAHRSFRNGSERPFRPSRWRGDPSSGLLSIIMPILPQQQELSQV